MRFFIFTAVPFGCYCTPFNWISHHFALSFFLHLDNPLNNRFSWSRLRIPPSVNSCLPVANHSSYFFVIRSLKRLFMHTSLAWMYFPQKPGATATFKLHFPQLSTHTLQYMPFKDIQIIHQSPTKCKLCKNFTDKTQLKLNNIKSVNL